MDSLDIKAQTEKRLLKLSQQGYRYIRVSALQKNAFSDEPKHKEPSHQYDLGAPLPMAPRVKQ